MSSLYLISKWYWIVGGSTTQVYSAASASFLPVSDAGYIAWLALGNKPTAIDTQADLIWVFQNGGYTAGAAGLSASS